MVIFRIAMLVYWRVFQKLFRLFGHLFQTEDLIGSYEIQGALPSTEDELLWRILGEMVKSEMIYGSWMSLII